MDYLFGLLIVFLIVSFISFGILMFIAPKGPHTSHGMYFRGDKNFRDRSGSWFWRKPWWAQILMMDVVVVLVFWLAAAIGLIG